MLSCCDADGEILSVLEFFAVGKTFRALFWCAVKGGGYCQCLNISAIFKVHLCRVPRLSVLHEIKLVDAIETAFMAVFFIIDLRHIYLCLTKFMYPAAMVK